MSLRIIHCADVHLETVFPETRGGAGRRKALADAFSRIVDVALARAADVLTIGGDLYESERFGPQTARFLFAEFARFGKPVYIAPGNHDPHSWSSPLTRADLPANVKVFTEAAWREYPLAEGISLYGFGHTAAEPGRPFTGARFERGDVRIALVHGSDEERCPPNKRATAPFRAAEVVTAGATFLLTGHYHGGYVVQEHGRPLVGYPGSPEPIKFGESPVHGALEIRIDGTAVEVAAIATARTRLCEIVCDLGGAGTERDVFGRIEPLLAEHGTDDYVRLRLIGGVLAGTRVDAKLLEESFGRALGSLDVLDETAAHDYAAIAREPTVRGHVARDLRNRGDEGAAALRYALAAFDGTEFGP